VGLWSRAGEFLGVAGVEIAVTKLIRTVLSLPGLQTERVSLVDGGGNKVVDSNDAGKRFRTNGRDDSLELEPFELPQVVEAMRKSSSGLLELDRGGKRLVVAFVRLDVLGWSYVVEAEEASVLGHVKDAR